MWTTCNEEKSAEENAMLYGEVSLVEDAFSGILEKIGLTKANINSFIECHRKLCNRFSADELDGIYKEIKDSFKNKREPSAPELIRVMKKKVGVRNGGRMAQGMWGGRINTASNASSGVANALDTPPGLSRNM